MIPALLPTQKIDIGVLRQRPPCCTRLYPDVFLILPQKLSMELLFEALPAAANPGSRLKKHLDAIIRIVLE